MCGTSRLIHRFVGVSLCIFMMAFTASSHPLGNFTINHFTLITVSTDRLSIRYVVDLAEIPAYRELQIVDTDGNGSASLEELEAYGNQASGPLAEGFQFTINDQPMPLRIYDVKVSAPAAIEGLRTLRLVIDLYSRLDLSTSTSLRVRFEDRNHRERLGWKEIVVRPEPGVSVFDSTAFGNGITDEIKAYPQDLLMAPLDERQAEFSAAVGSLPPGSQALKMRDGQTISQSRERLAELIALPDLSFGVALLGLLLAAALGAVHALSPGHGKTVVGAYLVGSRGTARHAMFLGLTVTITHTMGVFALGLVTLFAARYVVAERLYPILSLISGAIVLLMGGILFVQRLRSLLGPIASDKHSHQHSHQHHHADEHDQYPLHSETSVTHSHNGITHSHLPPGADGSRVTWRSLLALGVSGGLLPCPSALVVLLSAISLHRVGYGLLLVIAFSIGLAATLTAVGLLFVYARRLMNNRLGMGRLIRTLPVVSALVIAVAGAVICYEAISGAGIKISGLLNWVTNIFSTGSFDPSATSAWSLLALGLLFGLKHAVKADHIAAVSAIVIERRSIWSSSLVGFLWGIGHCCPVSGGCGGAATQGQYCRRDCAIP